MTMPDDDFTPDERALAAELSVDLDSLDAEPAEEPVEGGGTSATPRRRPLTFGRRL